MTPAAVADRALQVADVRARECPDAAAIRSAMVATRQIIAWADAQNAALIQQLSTIDSFPEATIADATKSSLSNAAKIKERAETLSATPTIAEPLEHGNITSAHVDAITRGSNRLEPAQRNDFAERVETLADIAAAGSVKEFSRRLDNEIKRIQSDDGEERLVRQRRNVRLNTWTDNNGMWNIRGQFDPVTGIRLSSQLGNTVQALFAEHTPDLCPTDPIEKNKFLAAHALDQLIDGDPDRTEESHDPEAAPSIPARAARNRARPEYVAVINADAPATCGCGAATSETTVDWPIPVELPARVLTELAADADVVGIVVRNGVVLHAPGEMNLGRGTRLASRDQRRALRGLYNGCAVPGCTVGFDRCKIHHVIWWRNGGKTNLDNLLPVCSKHHTRLHADEWLLGLGPHRELTITLPDGQVMTTGPPRRNAA